MLLSALGVYCLCKAKPGCKTNTECSFCFSSFFIKVDTILEFLLVKTGTNMDLLYKQSGIMRTFKSRGYLYFPDYNLESFSAKFNS